MQVDEWPLHGFSNEDGLETKSTQHTTASILKNRRVVFNIKGNQYRLIVGVAYEFGSVFIKFVGTHDQYSKVDAETVES